MPFLQVTTDTDISQEAASKVLGECAELCCNILSKPLNFMQTALNINASMTMGERQGHKVFAELKSIGLPGESVTRLSEMLTNQLSDGFKVSPENIYLVFQDVPREKWAWNGRTFG